MGSMALVGIVYVRYVANIVSKISATLVEIKVVAVLKIIILVKLYEMICLIKFLEN